MMKLMNQTQMSHQMSRHHMEKLVSTKNRNCNNKNIPRHSRQLQILIYPIVLHFGENLHV